MFGDRIDYGIERQRHDELVGRAALLAELDQLLIADRTDRWVVVKGGPGMGKSALLAAWLARCEAAGTLVPHHFIRRGEYDWDDPSTLVSSLVAQIEELFPDQREPDGDAQQHPTARLAALLMRVSANRLAPQRERLVVLIDGFDEYDPPAAPQGDRLAALLAQVLPRGVSFVAASRPGHPYVALLEAHDRELVQIDLDDPEHAADNDATVRAIWDQAAVPLGLDARFIDEAVACAGGNVQHAVMLRNHLTVAPEPRHTDDAIPSGLAALLATLCGQVVTDPLAVRGLGILCAAREALTLDELGAVAGWADDTEQEAFIRRARELLVESWRSDGRLEYRLHHDAIRSYIASTLGAEAVRDHHASLARRLATWPPPADSAGRRYALRHALIHRAEAGDWDDAWRLAADMGFLEAKCRELGAQRAEADVTRVAERCRANGEPSICRRFDDVERALVRESRWLRDAPQATAALVWNRLRRSGWSADDLDQRLRGPASARFLRVRHGTSRESPALARHLSGYTAPVTACAVTPDGRCVVSASDDRTIKVWDLDNGCLLTSLKGHIGRVTACAVTPDGRRVVSASDDRTLKVWDLGTGEVLATLSGHAGRVTACAVTPDGRRVVSASDDRTLKVWDLEAGRALASFEGHTGTVTACVVAPDGRRVVSASDDRTLKVWDLDAGAVIATLSGHLGPVTACAVTPDGQRVVSASDDRTLNVWDLETGGVIATFEGHAGGVNACAVTPDGRRMVSGSWDETVKVWDLDGGRVLTFEGHAGGVNACVVSPDGGRVVSATSDLTLRVWDLDTGRVLATFEGHAGWVTACAVTPDGRRVVSASWDRTLKVWDFDTGRVLATFEGHAGEVTACVVTPDGRRVISASTDQTVKVWDLDSGRLLASLEGHASWVNACAVTPDGRRVISASSDHTLKIWDLSHGEALASLEGCARPVTACAVTPDGRRVVSACRDGKLKIWDLEGRVLSVLEGHAYVVTACAVTPDGRFAVSASRDRTLKIWDLDSGRVVATLEGHAGWVNACVVTPDGRRVVSASRDQTLKVWDLDTYACILTHRGDAAYTAVAATATAIVAGDRTGAVWFLDWPQS